jgi:eukaryotic-like serine/threonine-protein kinase
VADFHQRECDVLGVSTDPIETHERWIGSPPAQGGLGGLEFPLASDTDGTVCKAYGIYLPRQHIALRGLFLIDPNGVLQYQVVHSVSVGRSTEEVLRVLDALQMGGLCPGEWMPGQPTLDTSRTLGPNRVVGTYRIDRIVGSGGFGTVFQAHDLTLERPVALKVLGPDAPRESLLEEARTAAQLNHPNICIIHAVESGHGVPMIVMEFVEGQSLADLLAQGPMPREQVFRIGRQVAQGIAAAHQHGIVHGDLKPANIMITPAGAVKIMDFGLARRVVIPSTEETALFVSAKSNSAGTPAYMAPEQARGEAPTFAADVFSFALVLFEMATGRRALEGASLLDVLRRLGQLDGQRLAEETQEPVRSILRQALIAEPNQRTVTMAGIAERLTA